jgi:hypothetical protein
MRVVRNRRLIPNGKTYASFGGGEGAQRLPELCLALFAAQREAWPDLRRGCESLKGVREKTVSCRGFSVRLQHNPERIQNALAGAGERQIAGRKCFLCPDHLPENQKGVLYRNEYLILCNPRPIFRAHFTVAHLKHRPQSIAGESSALLRLLADFGPGWTFFYNGPQCGASAPDHLHFQAAPAGQMPIEREMREEKRFSDRKRIDGVVFYRLKDLGREVVVMEGEDPLALERVFKRLLDALRRVLSLPKEPMVNVAGYHEGREWSLLVFPRRKHRPEAFFREGEKRVVVSPGAIDMGGVLIAPVEKDFERLGTDEIGGIYREVSLETEIVREAMDALR